MGSELEVPFQFSGIRVQREQTVGIKVIPDTMVSIPVRAGVAGAPEYDVLLGIVRARDPGGGGPGFRAVAAPRLESWFALGGDGPEAPRALAGLGVIGIDEAADPVFAARHPDDDLVLDRQGCRP